MFRAFVVALAVLLAACGSGPARKIHPSTAAIQSLAVQADGRWKLVLRVENFSTFPMRYAAVRATLSIDGKDAARVDATTDIEITGNSGDTLETVVTPASALASGREVAYALKGTIETREPKERFEFEKESRLSPMPGVADTWR